MENKQIAPSKQPKKRKNTNNNINSKLRLMALGGLGEVGKNCYVLEHNNGIYIIDFGVMFPGRDDLGIDYIVSNFEYLKQNEKKIKGLFITHGHEDHIGGIPFLLRSVKIPKIYAPQTANLMIQKKLKEHKITASVQVIDSTDVMKFKGVTVYPFRMTHSIPDAYGFFFETDAGNVVTTGDFKVDFAPPGQEQAEFHRMVDLSRKGVMVMMSDSTNAMTPGFSLSESSVARNLKMLINEAEGRIFFTTFASNIPRVAEIINGAVLAGRKVCVIGRSLTNAIDIGLKTKYINVKKADIIEPKQVKNYEPHELVIITTGSQGEELAALSRLATGQNAHISLSSDDTIVFASNPIPGNNYQIGRVIDELYKTGCKIIRNTPEFKTHASGHASIEEQKLILSLFKPDMFWPVHGTHNMLTAHKKAAVEIGIAPDDVFILRNGDWLEFHDKKPRILRSKVNGEAIYISNNKIGVSPKESNVGQLASEGILMIVCLYDKKTKRFISYPQITTRGFVVINESLDMLRKIQSEFIKVYNSNLKLKHDELIALLDLEMLEVVKKMTGKTPFVSTKLLPYEPDQSLETKGQGEKPKATPKPNPNKQNQKPKSNKPNPNKQNQKPKSNKPKPQAKTNKPKPVVKPEAK
ncbi:RNase J family beta-CASP ribonuclease [Mollicutes bacterium LVI A0039]|nr:RNase J family beta-CASP ribonuclease [Mollicutes bacterium LVI A0039]